MKRTIPTGLLCAAFVLLISVPVSAGTFDWTNWGSDTGTTLPGVMNMLGVNVTVNGPRSQGSDPQTDLVGFYRGYPSWMPLTTFAGGQVENGPPTGSDSIFTTGNLSGNPGLVTITFADPVLNPVIAIWSLGGQTAYPSTPLAKFDFGAAPFTIESGGPSKEFSNGTTIYRCDEGGHNIVCGNEGAGTIMFHGIYSSLAFTNPVYENNYAFTVGAQIPKDPPLENPEPASVATMATGIGVVVLGLMRRKR